MINKLKTSSISSVPWEGETGTNILEYYQQKKLAINNIDIQVVFTLYLFFFYSDI